jgi:putative aldouronate transport system permease protein
MAKSTSPAASLHYEGWRRRTANAFKAHWQIYIIILLPIIWYAIFAYLPMGGLQLAFKKYMPRRGIWGSPWNGLTNFNNVFIDPAFMRSIWRTLSINLLRLVFVFPFPIVLALLLNEMQAKRYKSTLQTIMTFPNFLSWVIVSSILTNVLASDGLVNSFLRALGIAEVNFLGSEQLFQPMLYITDIWKSSGWSMIVYLAAISGIDQDQYEAAEIDGANHWQKLIRITIPNLMPTIVVMFILATGNLMSAGFDQIFNLSNSATKNVAETLDMYIYRITFQSAPDYGLSTAISLMRSLVNMLLLLLADRGAKLMGGTGLFA